jgi:hypothetical protein
MGTREARTADWAALRLLPTLQWLAIGLLLTTVVRIEVGRWSLATIGWLVLVWAAHVGWARCRSVAARASWAITGLVSLAIAGLGVIAPPQGDGVVVIDLLVVAWQVATIWAVATTATELGVQLAGSWRRVAAWSVPAALLVAGATLWVRQVGEPKPELTSGASWTVGGMDMTLTGRQWLVVLVCALPMFAVLGASFVLFVRTYRAGNAAGQAATRQEPAARR